MSWRLFIGSLLLACAAGAQAQRIELRDDAGQLVKLAQPARRVVSLAPHLTELAFAAGGGDRVVGVMRYSDYPAQARALPVIGDAYALNFEAIAQLKPDLLLVWGSGLADRHKARLRVLGVPIYEAEIRDIDGIAQTLRRFGRLLGQAARADAQADALSAEWRTLEAAYAKRTPVRVFYQLWHEPLMTVNGQHGISQAMAACGGVNAFASLAPLTPVVSWEAAVQSNPQLVMTSSSPDEDAQLAGWQRFASQVEAVRMNRFAVLDGNLLGRMGPRFVQGARAMCEAIDRVRP
ncbi:cobalamin-binding protein [Caldimonas sp. KR1-144]|uniref:cobalamin-binding protein n=1 Tax=Caldimonas sp. KR1-144 TaxID=3400911 RepID=UPI003BFB03A7